MDDILCISARHPLKLNIHVHYILAVMSGKIKVTLSPGSFRAAAKEVQKYRDGLQAKCQTFVERLAEIGIQTAVRNTGSYGKYITFSVETMPEQNGVAPAMPMFKTAQEMERNLMKIASMRNCRSMARENSFLI